MDFQCFVCEADFKSISDTFRHLKKKHDIKNNKSRLKCIVKNRYCEKTYLNFDSLRNHATSCLQSKPNVGVTAYLNQSVNKIQIVCEQEVVFIGFKSY